MSRDRRKITDLIARLEELVSERKLFEAREVIKCAREVIGCSTNLLRRYEPVVNLYDARVLLWEGQLDSALSVAEAVLTDFRKMGLRKWIAMTHWVIAAIKVRIGQHQAAIAHAEAALYHYKWEVRDEARLAHCYDIIGVAMKNLGRWPEAESNLRLAFQYYPDSELAGKARVSLNLAVLDRKVGKLEEAANICKEQVLICLDRNLLIYLCRFCLELANISVVKGEIEEARRYVGDAREIAEREGYRCERVLVREIEGDMCFAGSDYERKSLTN